MQNYWRALLGKLLPSCGKRNVTGRRFRPVLEPLEDRLVPTTLSSPNNITGARNTTVPVPINVDTLSGMDAFNEAATGLDGAQFVVYFNPQVLSVASVTIGTITTGGSSSSGNGYAPATAANPNANNTWTIASTTTTPAGYLYIDLQAQQFQNFITGAATGSLAVINFTINSGAPLGTSRIDLAADTGGTSPFTSVLNNTTGLTYNLNNPPQDNTTLGPPYSYTGSDPADGTVTVTGTNLPPVVVNQSYSITERAVAGDPALAVAAPGVLQGDTDPQGTALTASAGSVLPSHGTVTLNSDGSFSYTPITGYLGTDTFTYVATDSFGASSTGTVTVSVTPRLSLQASASSIQTPGPVTLSGALGGTVKVLVDIDNPDPPTSGGLTGANFYIDYNPNVFSVDPGTTNTPSVDVALGTLTSTGGWIISTSVNPGKTSVNSGLDVLGISLAGATNTTTTAGSLVAVTFHINPAVAFGTSTIQLDPTNADGSLSTIISCANSSALYNFTLPLRPALPDPRVNATVNIVAPTLVITAPSNTPVAGTPFNFTVTARDASNNVATAYTGPVQITSSDTQAVLPPNASLTNGVGVFTITLKTVGGQTVTASDTARSTIAGSATFNVIAGVANHFAIAIPATAIAGTPFSVTVTAQDSFNNTTPAYRGTVHFTTTDTVTGVVVPADYTFVAADNGVHVFTAGATLLTAGNQSLTATDSATSSINGTSNAIAVSPAPATGFAVSAPNSTQAGTAIQFTVTALDQFYRTVTTYTGTVHFISSDNSATLPADATLTGGTGTFTATLKTIGSQTITAYDTVTNTIVGRSGQIAVSAGASHFQISAPSSSAAGAVFVFTVTALDSFNNVVAGYGGTVRLTSSDGQAALSGNATLSGGVGSFAAVLKTAGSQTITAVDTATSSIVGTSAPVTVAGLAANHFAITTPTSAITGGVFNFTVTAEDQFGNTAANYNGTVHFTSSDTSAVLPANTTLSSGSGVFSATLKTPGSQTISATDTTTPTIAASSNNIATLGLVVTSLTPTSTGFVATFNKPFDPTQINLYDTSGVLGPDDVLLTGPGVLQTSIEGSLLIDPSDQTVTFVKTSTFANPVNSFSPQTGVLTAGTYTVTFRSAVNGFKDLLGAPLDGTASGNPAGSNYTTTFVVSTTPAEVVGIPGFARGPGNTVNLPNNQAGVAIPISLSTGANVTSGKFTLQYNSALLSITGATVNSGLTGATLALDASSTPGNAVIDFSSMTALASGPVRLGGLVATVPSAAAALYKAKSLLHFSSVQLNGGAIAVTPDDAIELVAYFGDTNGDGQLSGGDAALISRVVGGFDNNPATGEVAGFSAYPNADPVLVADMGSTGSVSSADVTLLNSFLAGIARAQIPAIPTGLSIITTGPDPSLSVGSADLGPHYAAPGSTVIVPINIDTARPDSSTGMTEAILALRFDPLVFTVSPSDIQLGSLPLTPTPLPASGERGGGEGIGWQLQTAINNQTGEIGIDLFSDTPIQTTAAGSLVTITLHVSNTAPLGTTGLDLVTQVNPTGHRVYQTSVSDSQGPLALHPVLTPAGTEPGQPGQLTILDHATSRDDMSLPLFMADPIANFAGPDRQSVSNSLDVYQGAGAAEFLPTTSDPHLAPFNEVFANPDLLLMSENLFARPGRVIDSALTDATLAGEPASDLLLAPATVSQPDQPQNDYLAFLSLSAHHGRRLSLAKPLHATTSGLESAELAGIDLLFANEPASRDGQ